MNNPVPDVLGDAISGALDILAETGKSQDLAATYSLIGAQLIDSGLQVADDSQVREVAIECAKGEFTGRTSSDQAEKSATAKALDRLRIEGRKVNEKKVRGYAADEINRISSRRSRDRRAKMREAASEARPGNASKPGR